MDVIRKAVLLGLGALSLSQQKAEEIVDELIKRGEVASADRYRTVDRLLREAEQQEDELGKKITRTMEKVIAELGMPTRKDLEEISMTLKRIEAKLACMGPLGPTEPKDTI